MCTCVIYLGIGLENVWKEWDLVGSNLEWRARAVSINFFMELLWETIYFFLCFRRWQYSRRQKKSVEWRKDNIFTSLWASQIKHEQVRQGVRSPQGLSGEVSWRCCDHTMFGYPNVAYLHLENGEGGQDRAWSATDTVLWPKPVHNQK